MVLKESKWPKLISMAGDGDLNFSLLSDSPIPLLDLLNPLLLEERQDINLTNEITKMYCKYVK